MAKLLVVEDNEMVLDMMQIWLARHDFQVIIATNGVQAVTLAKSERPHLILLDMSLPIKNGWTVARELKASREFQNVPIIALTAYAIRGDRERALAAGCDDYMSKPFSFEELLKKIREYLQTETGAAF